MFLALFGCLKSGGNGILNLMFYVVLVSDTKTKVEKSRKSHLIIFFFDK